MEAAPAKESTDPVKQPNLGNLAVPEAKQKSTAATSNRTKILHQNYKTQGRCLERLTSAIQKLT